LFHAGRPAPAGLREGQVRADGVSGHTIPQGLDVPVEAPRLHVAYGRVQRGHHGEQADFSR